jgi:hypothetical protein
VRTFIALMGTDEGDQAVGGFLVGRDHYGRNTFLVIQGIDQRVKVAADHDQIRPWLVQSHIVGKDLFTAKGYQVDGEIQFLTASLEFLEIKATVQNENICFLTHP